MLGKIAHMPSNVPKSTYRLTPESVAAAKEDAYQQRISLNQWAQEAFNEKLARPPRR